MSNALFLAPSSLQNPTSEFKSDKIGMPSEDRTAQRRTSAKKLNGDGQSFLATLGKACHDRSLQAESSSAVRTLSWDKEKFSLSGRLQQACTEPSDDSNNAAADQTGISENFCQAETNANLSIDNFAGIIDTLQAMGFYLPTGGSGLQTSAASGQINGADLAALEKLIRDIQHNHLASAAELQNSAASGQMNGPDKAVLEQLIRDFRYNPLASAAELQNSAASGQMNGPDLAALGQLSRNTWHNPLASAAELQNSAASGQMNGPDLAALEQLIRGIQHNSLASAADLQSGFQHLQEFITAMLAGNNPSEPDGNPGRDLTPEQSSDPTRIGQWLKVLGSGQAVAPSLGGEITGEGALNEKSSDTVASGTLTADRLGTNLLEITGDNKGVGADQSAERPLIDSFYQDRKEANPDKSQDGPKFKNAGVDTTSAKEAQVALAGLKTLHRSEDPHQTASAGDRRQPNSDETTRASLSAARSTAAELKPGAVNPTEKVGQVSSGDESLARVLSESQGAKEVNVKAKTGIAEAVFGKVLKAEAGTNDNSLLNSAGQHAEKAVETAAVPKETAAGQNSPPTQALDQIVRRARIQLSGGQHEARVDLKPEFLGHVRLQVVAENHQVTLKILTEHGFVKDMIENNIHQLKADLQQQGMTIDKLEVSVSRDPDEFGSPKEKLFGSKSRQDTTAHGRQERPSDEKPKNRGRSFRRADGSVTLDYFA